MASLVCCRSTDSPWDDSAALVRGVRAVSPSLVLSATWGDALPHAALDHFHLWRLLVRHCVLCCAVISTAGLGPSGGSWPIHWRRHYVLGRNLVCLTGSSLRPRSGPVDTLKASEFAASKRTPVGLRTGNPINIRLDVFVFWGAAISWRIAQ